MTDDVLCVCVRVWKDYTSPEVRRGPKRLPYLGINPRSSFHKITSLSFLSRDIFIIDKKRPRPSRDVKM